jgi:hypothetical protein
MKATTLYSRIVALGIRDKTMPNTSESTVIHSVPKEMPFVFAAGG